MMEKRNFSIVGLEVREGNTAGGLAAPFNLNSGDLGGFVERIAPGAFTRSLAEAAAGTLNIYALWAHDMAQPLASTRSGKLTLTEGSAGLDFTMDTARMSPAQAGALADGDLSMSFGFRVRDQAWKEHEDGTIERTLIDVDLGEISFVINPAYPTTDAALRCLNEWREQRSLEVTAPEIIDTTEMLKRALRSRIVNR